MKRYLYIILFLLIPASVLAGPGSYLDKHNMGFVTKFGGFEQINYDLQWTGTNTANQTFSDAQVIDTVAEGIARGSLTVTDTAAGTVKVVSEQLELVGDGVDSGATGVVGEVVTKALGKALFFTHGANASLRSRCGFDTSSNLDSTPDPWYIVRENDDTYGFDNSGTGASITNTTTYKLALILGGYDSNGIAYTSGDTVGDFLYGVRFFIKDGAFTNWTLLWADPDDNTSTLYSQFNTLDTVDKMTLDNIYIPTNVLNVDTMFNPAYFDATPDLNVNDITIADAIIDTNVTFGAGVADFYIRFRYQDSENFWLVKCLSGTAGTDLTLHKTVATVEGASLASSDVDFTAAAHDIRIAVEGSTCFRVYVDGALKLTYNGPDTAFETETEVQLVDAGAAFVENTFTAHYRTNSSWDAAISAATGGTY